MPNNLLLWHENEIVQLTPEHPSAIKLIAIDDHVYILTRTHQLYHGLIETVNQQKQLNLTHCEHLHVVDIDKYNGFLYAIDQDGSILKLDDDLQVCERLALLEAARTCIHGCSSHQLPTRATRMAAGQRGVLFICENRHLWAMGRMPQLDVDSEQPQKVAFFEERLVYDVAAGDDLALAIVSKHETKHEADTDSDDFDEDVFVASCPHCVSSAHVNLASIQNCNLCALKEHTDSSSTSTSLSDKARCIHYNEETESGDESKTEKNIIFRNTEAARDFLARKISWMSSAGEEYLAECTEKPTRILMENMTNVASFVRTVGDRVVTLSRHVSGGSEDTGEMVELSTTAMPASGSREEFSWSLSVATSEREVSEQAVEERCNGIVNEGWRLINCEVWTWGNPHHGQLGIGDCIRRGKPMIISRLSNIGARKSSVTGNHAGVLTLDGRAFLWGRNDCNQVTAAANADQSSPQQFSFHNGDRVRDISCGTLHTAVLSSKLILQYLGKSADETTTGKPIVLCSSLSNKEMISSLELSGDVTEQVECETLTSDNYTLLNKHSYERFVFVEWLMQEQQFLEEMIAMQTNYLKPLQKKTFTVEFQVLDNLIESLNAILYFTAASVHSFVHFTNGLICDNEIIFFKHVDEHIFLFKKYFYAINSIITLDGFTYIARLLDIDGAFGKSHKTTNEGKAAEETIENRLRLPLQRLDFYEVLINTFLSLHNNPKILDVFNKWKAAMEEQEIKLLEAESTKQFWKNSGRSIVHLRNKERRLLRDSHKYPIHLQNASRFSTHWFILLTDTFLHVNGTTAHAHDLTTIWIEPSTEENYNHNWIALKMPEETLTLSTNEPEEKAEWLRAIQGAIVKSLKKESIAHLPAVRNAEYTFTKSGFLKDANYKGKWLNGKLHGYGRLQWPDGRVYTGQLNKNTLHGIGSMEIPTIGVYEGQWKDNQQNGYGSLKYNNGSIYKGWFKDGVAYGHGSLQNGKFMASDASVYVGDWINGSKCGYGVMDNIATGEKYLGNWTDNKKHGNGLIVTSDGIYFEGNFNQEVFVGNGLMILEDGTHYQGEFKGIGTLGGKGILTLNSGHTIEGVLSGSLAEGIKISNGTLNLMKPANTAESARKPAIFYKYCTPVNQKWKALFQHCYILLGIVDNNNVKNNVKPPDVQKIWQNIAIAISNSYNNSVRMNKCNHKERRFDISLNNLDTIPDFGRTTMDMKTYNEIKLYLKKAFQSPHHPLGSLLSHVTIAYTTTYGGPTAHALLLTHAVEELHSITKRLYELIRLLFPALPAITREISMEEIDCETINYHNLLYPVVLPKVYSQLFILYTLHNKAQDIQYWRRLIEWNKHSDFTLLVYLSVDQKFLEIRNQDKATLTTVRDQSFFEAVETLQLLKTTFSPLEKLSTIRETFKRIVSVMQELLGQDYNPTMDDLFPVFLYVVVRARILQLGSEIHFIEDFMEPSLENGELGLMFTTLKACYHQILQEKTIID